MSMSFLARDIGSRLHHRASLICPEYGSVIADLREISTLDLAVQKEVFETRKLEILSSYGFVNPQVQNKPFAFADGTAIIPIQGLLINRLSWGSSFATGYNFIRSQMQAALDDPDVQQIVFDVNSYGGLASGCGELAADIFAARDQKPSLAVVDSKAYSAAYYLASAAGRIVVTPSGGVGSIGTVAMHVDYSDALNEAGIKVTYIDAPEGGVKTDGNPYERLSKRAQASVQRDVDYHYGLFTEAVAQNRDLSVDDVIATKAACYLPPDALDAGLIDAVETPADAVGNFVSEIASDTGAFSMRTSAANGGSWKCGASRDLPVKESGSWDGPAASERMLDAAGFNGDNPNVTAARAGFLAYDAGDPKKKGSYKLPFADMVGGKKTAMRSGLNAAAQRLSQTDIPQSVKDEAQAVIDHYKPADDNDDSKDSKSGATEMDETQVKAVVATAVSEALNAERTRQSGIRTCDEAKGRETLAAYLADKTEMTVDAAKAVLAAAPKTAETPAGGANPFQAAMSGTPNPNLNPDGPDAAIGADTPEARATRILGSYGRATGKAIDLKAESVAA